MVKSSEVLMPTIVNKFVNSVQLKTFPNALHKSATLKLINNLKHYPFFSLKFITTD